MIEYEVTCKLCGDLGASRLCAICRKLLVGGLIAGASLYHLATLGLQEWVLDVLVWLLFG